MKNISIDSLKVSSTIKLNDLSTLIDVATSEKKKEKELQKIREKLSFCRKSWFYGLTEAAFFFKKNL